MNWGVFGRRRGRVHLAPCLANVYQFTCIFFSVLARGPLTGISSARYLTSSRESFEVTVSGGSTFARVKLKEIDGMAPQDVERAV